MDEREQLSYMAKMSEQAERYDQMANCMKTLAELGINLTNEERNLYSVAYKNKVGSRRSSWRVLKTFETKMASDEHKRELTKQYCSKIEKELKAICYEVLDTLDQRLIPKAGKEHESLVFYYKMKGDYQRYLREVTKPYDRLGKDGGDSSRDDSSQAEAEKAYSQASTIAKRELPSTHPIRLGLALNFSVFYFEIVGDKSKACHLAKDAFDTAIAELDSLKEESYKDSTLIMQLLRDNLTLWTADPTDNNDNSGSD